jgi:predicted DNA-binding transcriptional regulator AlpA
MNTSQMRVLSGFKEIASFLGLSTRTIFRHIDSIPVSRLGNKVMILESELVEWILNRSQKKAKKKKKLGGSKG